MLTSLILIILSSSSYGVLPYVILIFASLFIILIIIERINAKTKQQNERIRIHNIEENRKQNMKNYNWEYGEVPIIDRNTGAINENEFSSSIVLGGMNSKSSIGGNTYLHIHNQALKDLEIKLRDYSDYIFLRENGGKYNFKSIFDISDYDYFVKYGRYYRIIEYFSLNEIKNFASGLRQKIQEEEDQKRRIEAENQAKQFNIDRWSRISSSLKFEIVKDNAESSLSGVYLIHCVPTNEIYIGSSENMLHRKNQHLYDLQNKVRQHHSYILQSAFDKYGESNFKFYAMEYIVLNPEIVNNSKILKQIEQDYINKYKPDFNIDKDTFGKKHYL